MDYPKQIPNTCGLAVDWPYQEARNIYAMNFVSAFSHFFCLLNSTLECFLVVIMQAIERFKAVAIRVANTEIKPASLPQAPNTEIEYEHSPHNSNTETEHEHSPHDFDTEIEHETLPQAPSIKILKD